MVIDYSYGLGLGAPFIGDFKVTSASGHRQKPNAKASSFHKGTDFGTPVGTQATASLSGKVVKVGVDPNGYGNYVAVCDPETGVCAQWAHMDKIHVKPGDVVKQGQVIGLTGNSGNSTGPHLDYTVTKNGQLYNLQGQAFGDSGKPWLMGNGEVQAAIAKNTPQGFARQVTGAIMPSSEQANNPAFLQQMMQAPSQAIEQPLASNAPASVADFDVQRFLTSPTGWYGRTMTGV